MALINQKSVNVMNNLTALSTPITVRLNTVGDAVAVSIALQLMARGAAKSDETGIAARMITLADGIAKSAPDDWDCGDPDCAACSEGRLERGEIPRVESADSLIQFILNGRTVGEA